MSRIHDIVQRAYDKKWVVWTQVDDPYTDLDYWRRNGLPVPQLWVPIAVAHTQDEAERASKRSRI